MRILALDSSGLVASVAIAEDDQLLGEYTTNHKKTHSQTLLPMLAALMDQLDMEMDSIDAIAVAGGPGSFTGLRIGSATAKGLGLAADVPLIHIPTLEGLAYNLWGASDLICPLMDARRNQVYTGLYAFENGRLQARMDQCAIGIDQLIDQLNGQGKEKDRPVIFLGDGVPVFGDYIKEHCSLPYAFAPSHMNRQKASSLAALAMVYAREGRTETADEHKPEYLRLSQAERERLAAGKSITAGE